MKHFLLVVTVVVALTTCLALYGSVALFEWVEEQERSAIRSEFVLLSQSLSSRLLEVFRLDAERAEAVARAVTTSLAPFTRSQWSSFVNVYLSQQNSPEVMNLLRVIPDTERLEFEREMSLELGGNQSITQLSDALELVPAAQRPVYYPVTFTHPQTTANTATLLQDAGSVPAFRHAVEESVVTNTTVFSEPVSSSEASSATPGVTVYKFSAFAAVYNDQRRYGLVETVNSFGDLLLFFFGEGQAPHTGVDLLDCTDRNRTCVPLQRVSRDSPGVFFNANIDQDFAFSFRTEIEAGSRTYLLRFFATREFSSDRESNTGGAVLAACLVASILAPSVTVLLLMMKHRQGEHERTLLETQKNNEARVLAAETSANVKYSFVNYLFHEIRVPLNSTSIALQSILDQYARITENLSLLEKANVTLDHAIVVLNSVLDLEKMTQGTMVLDRRWFSMGQVLSECHHMHGHKARAKHITLAVEDRLPALDVLFFGDRVRLLQCLVNFTSNALKYTEPGGHVILRAQLTDVGHLRVEVQDNGVGVPEDKVPDLFHKYRRLQDSDHKLDATTGLGLSLVHSLVTLHGGRCGCSSTPHVGSTFWFDIPLPCRTGRPVHPAPMNSATATSVEMASAPTLKVLVVDDDPVGREVMSEVLRRKRFEVQVCADGAEVVEMATARIQEFDVILMDKTMPRTNGVAATQQLKRRGITVPVVGLTGNALQRDIQEFRDAGVVACLTKPVNMVRLVDTLRQTARAAATT